MLRLKDKVAIITGAGQGIGREYAFRFAKEGAKVVIAEINMEKAQAVETEILRSGGEAMALRTDVSDENSTLEMAKAAMARYGRIDILLNNAAIYYGLKFTPMEQLRKEEWRRILEVNVIGQWLCAKAVLPYMRKQGKGKIINMASDIVWSGVPGLLHYVASKGAVIALTRALAAELGAYNINVNAIAPGYTMTEASLKMAEESPQWAQNALAKPCFQRDEQPSDLPGTAVFLASEDSDFITGQTILVNGGQVLR